MPPEIIILGPFPPPLHGFSQANLAMRGKFEDAGLHVVAIDTASGRGSLARVLGRLRSMSMLIATLVHPRSSLYLPVSGGNGQWADLAAILLARLFGRRVVLHHHSFAYLNRFSRLANLLFRAAGRDARHIVLGSAMRVALVRQYESAKRIETLSNAALTEIQPDDTKEADRAFTIGFLSNITLDKGIDRFVAIHARLRESGIAAVIAGPVVEASAQSEIDHACSNGAAYLGAVFGESKASFFRTIDVLVFPTRYTNEAEPFVILEALACGTPVIASRRGCIASLIDESCGLLLDASAGDIAPAADLISRWSNDSAAFNAARAAASARFAEIKSQSDEALSALLAAMKAS